MTKRKRRDWKAAIAKIRQEGHCRFCGRADIPLETAHILGRAFDRFTGSVAKVEPDEVIPLCASFGTRVGCHSLHDQHEISVFPHLKPAELTAAIALAGLEQALHRLKGRPRAGDEQKPTSRRALDLGC